MTRFGIVILATTGVLTIFGACPDIGVTPDDRPDTTSHSFAWTQTLLGDGGGSILRDVAIINDTLAYAVGEMRLQDSSGQWDSQIYNLAIWNGVQWMLKRVMVEFRGNTIIPPLEGIVAFSPIGLWLVGSLPIFGDGATWTMFDLRTTLDPNLSLSTAWGSDPNEMYFAGRSGSLVRYTQGTWQKLDSGTNLPIHDIWGAKDERTGEWEILAVASSSQSSENRLLQILPNNTVIALDTTGLSSFSRGIWFLPGQRYYIVGSGIHQKKSLGNPVWNRYDPGEVTRYGSATVYGQALNDVFVAGSFLELVHFNGSSWYSYENEIPFTGGALGGVSIKHDVAIVVGYLNDGKALTIIGRK